MSFRNRVKELVEVKAGSLKHNPKNWAVHPESQAVALRGVLSEVGIASGLVAYRDGEDLVLIDGHLRLSEFADDDVIPVQLLDVTPAEADKLLATMNPIAGMVKADQGKLDDLIAGIEAENDGFRNLVESLSSPLVTTTFEELDVRPPPRMAWVLVGVPTVEYGRIAPLIEKLATTEGVVCQTANTNG